MQVTKEVNEVIVAAIEYARENKHEYVTAEHILYKCTFIEKVQNAMEKCGADIENLRKNKPEEGLVQVMKVTEKQYGKMEFLVGEKKFEILDTDERLVIL